MASQQEPESVPGGAPKTPSQFEEFTEREKQIDEDYDWALRDPEVHRLYRGQVVAVHKKTVWGAGDTHGEAIQDALRQPGCPPREELAKVYIEGEPLGPLPG
jgi:hypothetical protein